MFSVYLICSRDGGKFQNFWGVLRLSPGQICGHDLGRHYVYVYVIDFRLGLKSKAAQLPRGNQDCFLRPWTGFQIGPEHHMFHVMHRICDYSCLEIGPVVCRRLNEGTIIVEHHHCVTFPKLGICLCGERWTVRGPLEDHMGWRCDWEEETVFLQFLVINSVHIYCAGLFCFSTSNQCVFLRYRHIIWRLNIHGNYSRKR